MPLPSGFYINQVVGHLRIPHQIEQWNISRPDPIGLKHWESGQYRPSAKLGLRGGFNFQFESGVAINFGSIYIADSGFYTDTVALTLNLGEVNSHPSSFFDLGAFNIGTNFKAFNMRFWLNNQSAFSQYNPIFYYKESSGWLRRFILRPNSVGAQVVPSSLPDAQNLFVNGSEIFMSGAYRDSEFSNFLYLVGKFPSGIIPFELGTYGGLGQKTFSFRFSVDWSAIDAQILPGDSED